MGFAGGERGRAQLLIQPGKWGLQPRSKVGPVDGDFKEQTLGPGDMAKPLDRALTEGR